MYTNRGRLGDSDHKRLQFWFTDVVTDILGWLERLMADPRARGFTRPTAEPRLRQLARASRRRRAAR
jgi:hypothetical protein